MELEGRALRAPQAWVEQDPKRRIVGKTLSVHSFSCEKHNRSKADSYFEGFTGRADCVIDQVKVNRSPSDWSISHTDFSRLHHSVYILSTCKLHANSQQHMCTWAGVRGSEGSGLLGVSGLVTSNWKVSKKNREDTTGSTKQPAFLLATSISCC